MRPLYVYDMASVFSTQIRTAEAEAGRVFEAMIGLVVDNNDDKKLGRVRVKLPVLSMQESTWWAPIIMLGAGKDRGWFFIPEIDDEVLVMFEQGDLSRPIVVGSLWNGKDTPPEKQSAANPRRLIKSRAGSLFVFDDEKNEISIEDGGGAGKITISADAKKITIEATAGDVCIQAPNGQIKIVTTETQLKATGNVEIHAGTAMAFGADGDMTVDGGSSMTFSGSKTGANGGGASAPAAPTATPASVPFPFGS